MGAGSHYLCLALLLAILFPIVCSSGIWEACCNDDVETVQRLQAESPTQEFLLQKNLNDDTPLHVACTFGSRSVVKALLNTIDCKHLYATNKEGLTPLLASMDAKKFDIARLLIEKDPSREHLTILGDERDALFIAATSGQITVLQCLLEHLKPEDLFRRYRKHRFSILMIAASAITDNHLVIELLLNKDTTNTLVLERISNGYTALNFARIVGSPAIELLEREQHKRLMERFLAIMIGNVQKIRNLMATSRFNVENFLLQKDQDCKTPMLLAVEHNRLDVVKVLLNVDGLNTEFTEGRPVDYRKQLLESDLGGDTPLTTAQASNETRAIASLLLDTDTSREHLTSKSEDGSTPLMNAAHLGDLEMMERILEHLEASDILDVDHYHRSALIYAASTNTKHPEVSLQAIRRLLAKDKTNFLVFLKDGVKMMPFDIAKRSQNLPEALHELKNSQKKAKEALDQVISACRNGDVEAVKTFMRQTGAAAGQILCLRNDEGATPMIEAVKNNQIDVVKVLVNAEEWHTEFCNGRSANYRAQLVQSDKEGDHPLSKALLRNADPEIALLFLDIDASRKHISHQNYRGQSPLMLAAENLHLEALRRIFMYLDVAELFEVDNIQESPLMFAAKNKDDDNFAAMAVAFLLVKDSTNLSVLMRNRENQTALDLATKNGRIYSILKSRYENARRIHEEVMQACEEGNEESVKNFMIRAGTLTGALLSIPAEDGDTPLIRAISNNQSTVVRMLLNEDSWHSFAIDDESVDYQKQLLVRGSNGSPPLIWALESSEVEPSIATLLIHLDESSEHMLVKDSKGRNAAMVAASQGRLPQLRQILSHLKRRDLLLQSKDEGKNVLMYALEEPENDSKSTKDALKTVNIILEVSIDLRLQFSKSSFLGMTALEYARQQSRTRQDVINLLEKDRIEKCRISSQTNWKIAKSSAKRRKVEQTISNLGYIFEESKLDTIS